MKLDDAKQEMGTLQELILFGLENGQVPAEVRSTCKMAGLNIRVIEEVVRKGQELRATGGSSGGREPTTDDVLMLSYTSGTTGMPKGVQLTHKMILSCIYAVNVRFQSGDLGLSNADTYISYLPAAHLFEQVMFSAACQYGMRAGYFSGDVTKLVEDCGVLKPTIFPSVPRLYNRIYGKI